MTTDIATISPPTVTPLVLLQQAIDKGMDADQLTKLMDLQERYERNRAAEVYGAAITEFQKRCPAIVKERKADAGSLKYQYASFDDVMRKAGPILTDCGIALSFSTESNERGIRVTVKIRVGIHAEECTLDVPIPDMKVNATQRYGAALSYAKRYALCAALNIVVTDEDDDAQSAYDPVTMEQEIAIAEFIEQNGLDKTPFLKWLAVDRICDIAARDFDKAMNALRNKAAEKKKAGAAK